MFDNRVNPSNLESIFRGAIRPIKDIDYIPSSEACKRISVDTLRTKYPLPEFDFSQVDGYALGSHRKEFNLIGEVKIGEQNTRTLKDNECQWVPTGAMIPKNTYAMVKVENTEVKGHTVRLIKEVIEGQEIVRAGSDFKDGEIIVEEGSLISETKVALLSAFGFSSIRVFKKPRITIFVTGHEIKKVGQKKEITEVYDSISPLLSVYVQLLGGQVIDITYVDETVEDLRAKFATSLHSSDLIITIGGTSMGKQDNVKKTVELIGETIFHGISLRPGKPLYFGKIELTPVIGFPGFFGSSIIMANFVLPTLFKVLTGVSTTIPKIQSVELSNEIKSYQGFERLIPGTIRSGVFVPTFSTSSSIRSISEATGFVHVKQIDGSRIPKGGYLKFTEFLS